MCEYEFLNLLLAYERQSNIFNYLIQTHPSLYSLSLLSQLNKKNPCVNSKVLQSELTQSEGLPHLPCDSTKVRQLAIQKPSATLWGQGRREWERREIQYKQQENNSRICIAKTCFVIFCNLGPAGKISLHFPCQRQKRK